MYMFGVVGETHPHDYYIVSACNMLAQKDYKRRHDKVCLHEPALDPM